MSPPSIGRSAPMLATSGIWASIFKADIRPACVGGRNPAFAFLAGFALIVSSVSEPDTAASCRTARRTVRSQRLSALTARSAVR